MLTSVQDEASGANFLFYSTNATTSNLPLLQLDYSSGSVFNESGVNYQHVRMESDTDSHAFYLNAVNGNIGMGAGASPSLPLSVGSKTGANLNYINGTANTISTDSGIFVSKTTTNEATVGFGLQLANNSNVADTRSPLIGFSALSASSSYNHTYAAIWGLKSGNGADTNWNTGQLHFGTSDGTGVDTRMKLSQVGGLITLPAANGHAVFNENGVDADFRVESDGNSSMFVVDGGSNYVTVGDSASFGGDFNIFGATGIRGKKASGYKNASMIRPTAFGYSVGTYAVTMLGDTNTQGTVSIGYDPVNNPSGSFSGTGVEMLFGANMMFKQPNTSDNGYVTQLSLVNSTGVIINDTGADLDFRVESDGNANMLFVDGGQNKVGIGGIADVGTGIHRAELAVNGTYGQVFGNASTFIVTVAIAGAQTLVLGTYTGSTGASISAHLVGHHHYYTASSGTSAPLGVYQIMSAMRKAGSDYTVMNNNVVASAFQGGASIPSLFFDNTNGQLKVITGTSQGCYAEIRIVFQTNYSGVWTPAF
tara:strand:- start:291 stop:1898 length:1608 start_codon:yes stop_codon:yes gene_type:complete